MAHSLLSQLHVLLESVGQKKTVDAAGNVSYVTVKLFEDENLEVFLKLAEKATANVLKTMYDVSVVNPDLVVEYAFYLALTSRSLIEKGREYAIQDNGMYFDPPHVSAHMINVASMVFENWLKKVQLIRG